jgi:hypothetical protein
MLLLGGCHDANPASSIDLVLPDGVGKRVELTPKTAFAEYVELPELRRELRLTLASYELSCDHYVLPQSPSDVLFVLTLTAPPRDPFEPGTYPLEAAAAPDAGPPERISAFAVARQGTRGFEFPSGGTVELKAFDPAASGHVSGVLGLEYPGDGSRPPAGAHGRFDARMCRGE